MKKFLTSKVAVGVVILLFLVGAIVEPKEACRVLIKGKEEAWVNDKPSVLVLQTLAKGPVPPPGNPGGQTPGGPRLHASTTNTRAFASQAVAPPHGYSNHITKSTVAANRK
ncbi:hypothetical protein NL676_002759 [Syzygium grande]|nr:hypothetical protein NL676_002759 [Syzygium grande]